jgi:hypothetical protein
MKRNSGGDMIEKILPLVLALCAIPIFFILYDKFTKK